MCSVTSNTLTTAADVSRYSREAEGKVVPRIEHFKKKRASI